MFYVTKFIYTFLLPPGIFILLLLALSIWQYRFAKKRALLLMFFALCLYALSTPYVSTILITSLESRYTPSTKISGDVLVMLGGGATANVPDIDGTGQLSGSAANRLLTTARLYYQTRLPILLSGGQVFSDSSNEALIAKRQLVQLGIPEKHILIENKSRNTEENARYVKKILKEHNFTKPVLITSAFHMERALRNFKKLHINTVPYPTDYKSNPYQTVDINKFVPSAGALSLSSMAMKEYMGIAALSL